MPTSQKKPAKKPAAPKKEVKRALKHPSYKTLRLHKRITHPQGKLLGSVQLTKKTAQMLWQNKKLIGGITLIYTLLSILLVRGLASTQNLSELKGTFNDVFQGQAGNFSVGLVLFTSLIGSAGTTASAQGSVYQTLLLIIVGLATIWALRQRAAGKQVTVKDSFYKGLYPLVPFSLVLLVIGFQFIPLAIGNWLYSTVISNGIAVSGMEKTLWVLIFFLLALLSLYMICSSLFALFIVTLPDMTPMRALRSARQLVLHRRWMVLRKVLFLPLILLIASIVIMLPILIFATAIAEWTFFFLSMAGWVICLTYMYTLYRELLNHE